MESVAVKYNTDGGVEFMVGHRMRNRDTVLMAVKNYSIRRNAEYMVVEEVRKIGAPHTCLALVMAEDHSQLDSTLMTNVVLPLVKTNPSVSISLLQSAVQQSYHFKPSYRK
ncbi:hypothetical protein PIB30_095526, partial [Stylosanthes scabra]|nr:hypothetical protein [Stylosanthes scabra]